MEIYFGIRLKSLTKFLFIFGVEYNGKKMSEIDSYHLMHHNVSTTMEFNNFGIFFACPLLGVNIGVSLLPFNFDGRFYYEFETHLTIRA